MARLKKYNEVKSFNLDTRWLVDISSTVNNTFQLSKELLEDAIQSPNDPIIKQFHEDLHSKMNTNHKSDVLDFQINKKNEIKRLFMKNLQLDFNEDKITLSTKFFIEFPKDWERGDVIGWCEGFNRINCEWLFLQSEKFLTRDNDLHIKVKDFFDEILKNEKFNVKSL